MGTDAWRRVQPRGAVRVSAGYEAAAVARKMLEKMEKTTHIWVPKLVPEKRTQVTVAGLSAQDGSGKPEPLGVDDGASCVFVGAG